MSTQVKAISMTKKATGKAPAAASSSNGNVPKEAAQPDYKLLPLKELQPSSTNPRRRIDETTIETLAASIRTQGVLEPLIVRENGKDAKKYEIVCGERRYRAAKLAGLTDLPCLVRKLSDEQVLDIQIHENLHREDIHPMDEAFGYRFLKDKLNCDIKELALRVGKSEGYVLNRLKLNLLIKEAQKGIDNLHLPLVFALEIAKYPPDIQKVIYGEVYRKERKYGNDHYTDVPVKRETVPFRSFVEWINTNVHRLLSKAPFDPKAENLRDDGLSCTKCPDRTGAVAGLFEPTQVGKKDACLNPPCYIQKSERHIEVRRMELAKLRGVEPKDVPIVRSWGYSDGEGYLGTKSAEVISGTGQTKAGKPCDKTVSGIDIEPDNYGKTVEVCLKSTGCSIHWAETGSNAGSGENENPGSVSAEAETAERLENHRIRREEIWNCKVAEAVRVLVFKQAAESFEKTFSIADVGIDLLPQLTAKFWRMTVSGDSHNLNAVVKPLIGEWSKDSKTGLIPDGRSGIEEFKKLDRNIQYRILFLLIHCHKGSTGYGNRYLSQKEVREIAAEFKVDYSLIDAETRLQLCPKKHREVNRLYLESVRAKKKDAKVPRLFSEKWKAID